MPGTADADATPATERRHGPQWAANLEPPDHAVAGESGAVDGANRYRDGPDGRATRAPAC